MSAPGKEGAAGATGAAGAALTIDALFAALSEGAFVVSSDGTVRQINAIAAAWVGAGAESIAGRDFRSAFRVETLRRFTERALGADEPVEGEIRLNGGEEKVLSARGVPLKDTAGRPAGALVVIQDLTRLKQLEQIRRDFVANVSHELKTPITAIKGFIETLKDGALHDPENAEKFLDIAAKQADRLNAIIEDLLSLARIEQDQERGEVALEERGIREALENAIEVCGPRAAERQMRLTLDCSADLVVPHNHVLMEQAVVNLIDNAIKYSDPGSEVNVGAERTGREIAIRVKDNGHGIEEEHLPRLFERFYRVDKARSRKLGGTGLGLAIVKHICMAHGAEIAVTSEIGKGSVFTIRLPAG